MGDPFSIAGLVLSGEHCSVYQPTRDANRTKPAVGVPAQLFGSCILAFTSIADGNPP